MNTKRYLAGFALAIALLWTMAAQAQLTAHIEWPVYDQHVIFTGDRVNKRKAPDVNSPRLLLASQVKDGHYQSYYLYSNEAKLPGTTEASPCYGNKDGVYPLLERQDEWAKIYESFFPHIEKGEEVWVSAKYVKPVGILNTKRSTFRKYWFANVYDPIHVVRRTAGKFKDLVFYVAANHGDGYHVHMTIPFRAVDGKHFVVFQAILHKDWKGEPITSLFEYNTGKDITGSKYFSTTINLGPVKGDFAEKKVADMAKKALMECSDEVFEEMIRKVFIDCIEEKKEGLYDVRMIIDRPSPFLNYASRYPKDAPGAHPLEAVLDFTKNTDSNDPDTF